MHFSYEMWKTDVVKGTQHVTLDLKADKVYYYNICISDIRMVSKFSFDKDIWWDLYINIFFFISSIHFYLFIFFCDIKKN